MSSRRPTRAASRAGSSSRGVSPTPAAASTTTPRRSGRGTSNLGSAAPLPTIGTRQSTSYGSGLSALPVGVARTLNQTLNDTLGTILATEGDTDHTATIPSPDRDPAPSGRGRGQGGRRGTPVTPRGASNGATSRGGLAMSTPGLDTSNSFNGASALFGTAHFDDSILQTASHSSSYTPNVIDPVAEEEEPDSPQEDEEQEEDDDAIRALELARRRELEALRRGNGWLSWPGKLFGYYVSFVNAIIDDVKRALIRTIRIFGTLIVAPVNVLKWMLAHAGTALPLILLATAALFLRPAAFEGFAPTRYAQHYSHDIQHSIRQYIPYSLAHPLHYFNEDDVFRLQVQMAAVEADITWLKRRVELDQASVQHLMGLLPDFVLLKKDKSGEKQIPADFWRALKSKIVQEPPILKYIFTGSAGTPIPNTELGAKQVEKIAVGAWSDFLDQNEARIKAWQGDVFDDMWSAHLKDSLKDDVLISRSEVIDLVQKAWRENKHLVEAEIRQLTKKIDRGKLTQTSSQSQPIDREDLVTPKQVRAISTSVFEKLIPSIQLEALSKVKTQEHVSHSLRQVNHFSVGVGAVINPKLTSPTYQFNQARANMLTRSWLWLWGSSLPPPHRPIMALTKWDEQGDCWCSPTKGDGAGLNLAIMTANELYPNEVVIEHIPQEATLSYGSAPREMELMALIEGWNDQSVVGEMSDRIFPSTPRETFLEERWIRIAKWTYESNSGDQIQAFPVQVDLQSLKAPTRQLIVRALNNWGGDDHTCLYRVRLHGEIVKK